jgi:methionyl-tRNA formyltransferase
MVGITVHEVSAALDGGAIYERASVQLEPSDDVFTAFARCVKLGGLKYAEVAGRLAAGEALKPVSQDLGAGRAYRFTDRTFVHDIVTDYRFLTGKTKRLIQSAKRF